MDKRHSVIIIILLAGILFVMLAGREAAIEFLVSALWIAFWLALIVGITVGTIAMLISAIRENRALGRPWLYLIVAWPSMVVNFVILGLGGIGYFRNACQSFRYDCIESIPLWWLPICVFCFGIVIGILEIIPIKLKSLRVKSKILLLHIKNMPILPRDDPGLFRRRMIVLFLVSGFIIWSILTPNASLWSIFRVR